MEEIQLPLDVALSWFEQKQSTPYLLVEVGPSQVDSLIESLGAPVRRCYITDTLLSTRAAETGKPELEILNAVLPDAGSTMAGDFGEILVYCFHAAQEHSITAFGPKKWRLKQDRTKPAPFSDVVHFSLPNWPESSENDVLFCSEVKTKSTNGSFSPITAAISDCQLDRTSRLAKTLVWLRERALTQDLGTLRIEHLERFINALDHPLYEKRFYAVAVVGEEFLSQEIADAPANSSPDYVLLVISVPNLREVYSNVFEAARATMAA